MNHVVLRSTLPTVVGLVIAAAMSGCGGGGGGSSYGGGATTPPPAPAPAPPTGPGNALTATFSSIQDNVFTPICTACHAGASAPRGLRLEAGSSYALLVGVDSSEVPTIKRVAPGNPDGSYLIQKLRGTASVGGRMPLGGPFLSDATINTIAQWITNGAPQSSAPAFDPLLTSNNSGLQVITSAPLDNDVVEAPLRQLIVGFDRELDPNLVNASTVTLESTDTHAQIPTRLSVPIVNPSSLLINTSEPLARGTYRLTLRGTGGGALAGLNAKPLNSAGGFTDGRDQSIEFHVGVR